MKKKTVNLSPQLDWNPANKEPWHHEFDKELVNDEKWSCIVAAVVPSKVEDEECIQIFKQSVASGLRKSIVVVTAADVVKILQGNDSGGSIEHENKKTKNGQINKGEGGQQVQKAGDQKKKNLEPPPPRKSPIINLAAKYALITETELKLPPDLMAAILKYLIFNIKQDNIFRKKVLAVKARKMRERNLKANFIKSIKPFKATAGESFAQNKNPSAKSEPINDEPYPGPDLYIVLSDFYDPLYYPELIKINVPFLALFKVTNFREMALGKFSQMTGTGKPDVLSKKDTLISYFWKTLADSCTNLHRTAQFKDFIFMEYQPQVSKTADSGPLLRDLIFDEISWLLYSVFFIYRQHQAYLQQMHVQRMVAALEPLDLSRCQVYNQLCDDLVTADPCAVLLILYALVEQVAVGVPPTGALPLNYEAKQSPYFSKRRASRQPPKSQSPDSRRKTRLPTPSCQCPRNKTSLICCNLSEKFLHAKTDRPEESETVKEPDSKEEEIYLESAPIRNDMVCTESLVDPLAEAQTKEKVNDLHIRPILCSYGDKLLFYTFHCNWRLINFKTIVSRFFKKTDLLQVWSKYPDLSAEKKAFYNYHFLRLQQMTRDDKDLLKIKIFFLLSMKLIGITKSYLYKGEEESLSELFPTPSRDKSKKYSKVKFDHHGSMRQERREDKNFSLYFFRPFNSHANAPKRVTVGTEYAGKHDRSKSSTFKVDSVMLRKVVSLYNMSVVTHRNSGYCFCYNPTATDLRTASSPFKHSQMDQELLSLHSLLDCYEISSLSETHVLNTGNDYVNLINNFNFFEILDSETMVQRLLEAVEDFNTTQCSYFPPTDTLMVILHNESDHRGVFFTSGYGSLTTPICLRDFYGHVYPEIGEWLASEREEYLKFGEKIEEKARELQCKQDKEYLFRLKREFKTMTEEEKKQFLSLDESLTIPQSLEEIDVVEDELEDLPLKPEPEYPRKVSFIGTNFMDIRIETARKVHEFHSRDGTQINLSIDSWLHETSRLLTLEILKSKFRFWYHQYIEEERNSKFFLKTSSGTLFFFHKKDVDYGNNTDTKYHVRISWPTGLMVQHIFNESNLCLKQYYLTPYKKWWNLDAEKCRYFLKNGQIIIFNQNDQVKILCPSGTKHFIKDLSIRSSNKEASIFDTATFRTTTMTGQVWEKNNLSRDHCGHKPKLVDTIKVFIGIDPKTQETYYRREDGVSCMLWPNGKLVTVFPDGTKITSTPEFEPVEIVLEWTEQEKIYFSRLESYHREEMLESGLKSKTILKKSNSNAIPAGSNSLAESTGSFESEGFMSISVSYLMEHPKYSAVYYDSGCPEVEVRMPDKLSIKTHPDGTHLVSQENNFLAVKPDTAELYTVCPGCGDKSHASIFFKTDNTLCKFVDLVHAVVYVYRNGEAVHHEPMENDLINKSQSGLDKSCAFSCLFEHIKSISGKQRCFALEKDLSGIEFIHRESLARDFYKLPSDTHYSLHGKSETTPILTHVFSIPHHRVGHEIWTMNYEVKDNSTPTNLKKKDLKELGFRENSLKLYKYPFSRPREPHCEGRSLKLYDKPKIPKLLMTRVVKCLSENPKTIIDELKVHIGNYQRKAFDTFKEYQRHKSVPDCVVNNERQIKRNLSMIGLPSDPWWVMNSQISTEVDVHRSGHYLNFINDLNASNSSFLRRWPQCKQSLNSYSQPNIPIYEQEESPRRNS